MKIINRQNFFATGCVIFTMLVIGKLILEFLVQGLWENYQENLLIMFLLSFLATFVLSQHYRFQKYPLLLVIMGQYVLLIAFVMFITWLSGRIEPLHEDGYRDMFLSFTIPYFIGVVVYYGAVFHEIGRANRALQELKAHRKEQDVKLEEKAVERAGCETGKEDCGKKSTERRNETKKF